MERCAKAHVKHTYIQGRRAGKRESPPGQREERREEKKRGESTYYGSEHTCIYTHACGRNTCLAQSVSAQSVATVSRGWDILV